MKALGHVVFGLVCLVVLGGSDETFKRFVSKEGGFSIVLPGTPKRSVTPQQSPYGVVNTVAYEAEMGEVFYMVGFVSVPAQRVKDVTTDRLLLDTRNGMLKASKGTLISERAIVLGRFRGREIRTSVAAGKGITTSRIYVVGAKLIITTVAGSVGDPRPEQIINWLNTLKIDTL